MFDGFKSLSSTRKQNMITNSLVFVLLWLMASVLMDAYLENSNNPMVADVKKLDVVEKSYVVDGKTYTLKQQVKLIDGVLSVEKIEDVK